MPQFYHLDSVLCVPAVCLSAVTILSDKEGRYDHDHIAVLQILFIVLSAQGYIRLYNQCVGYSEFLYL